MPVRPGTHADEADRRSPAPRVPRVHQPRFVRSRASALRTGQRVAARGDTLAGMTTPLPRPKRKDPIKRTRLPALPPAPRSREAQGLTAVAAEGRFALQRCGDCGRIQYPPRQLCGECLSGALAWRDVSEGGTLLAGTTLHHSNDVYFRERLPWRLGLVRLDCGPAIVAHVMEDCRIGDRVRMSVRLDRSGRAAMLAMPPAGEEGPNMNDDLELRETTCHPRHRRVLVTDGKTAAGQALVRAFAAAEAREVYVGNPDPWHASPALAALAELPGVTIFPLDVTDSRSVHELASRIGAKVEILVNNGYHLRPGGIRGRKDINTPRAEMDVNYFGLLRLAREFGPVLRERGADGVFGAAAWVNVLSIYALVNNPAFATYSASLAAARSLSQCLRTELLEGGVKVVNVFPGPLEDEWQQLLPPPKLTPEALADAVVKALGEGVEDVYPGAVAQEINARLRENSKEVERELSL